MATDRIAIAHVITPKITAYPWSAGFGSKYSNPGTLPNGPGYTLAWGASDIIELNPGTNGANAYPWSSGFGTRYSNPGTSWVTSYGYMIHVTFDRNSATVGSGSRNNNFQMYPWSAGFGTKYSNPGSPPSGYGYGCAFGASVVAGTGTASPYIYTYPW